MLTKHYSDCMSLQMMLSFCDISISNGAASTSGIRAGGMLLPQAKYKNILFIKILGHIHANQNLFSVYINILQ